MVKPKPAQFVVCIENAGYPASLETRKIYIALPDPSAEKEGLLRIVDESGEAYLYPNRFFTAIELSPAAGKAVLAA